MPMLKFQCNIWNYAQSESSRDYYVQILHYLQFLMDYIKLLWTFSSDVCTDLAVHLMFHGILMYPQIISNIDIFMTWWNNFCFNDEAWNMQQWFGLISLFVFQLQTLFSIHFFMSEVYLLLWKKHYQHNIQVKIWTHTLPLSFSFG